MAMKTTVNGAFPKPQVLRRALWLFSQDDISAEKLAATQRKAGDDYLKLQEELGIDLRSDGQMDRDDMVSFLVDRIDGLERGGLVRVLGNHYYRRPLVVGDLGHTEPVTVAGWQAAKQQAGGAAMKAVLTGPYTLMHWSSDQHYNDRKKCALAFADVVKAEAAALVAAGVEDLQIDEPAADVRPDELDTVCEGIRRVAEAVGDKARLWIQMAYGTYDQVLPRLAGLPLHGVSIELVNNRMAALDRLGALPDSLQIAAGVVDAQHDDVESVDAIVERAGKVAEVVGKDRLWLAPDAGLQYLSPETATAKLRNLAEAAVRM